MELIDEMAKILPNSLKPMARKIYQYYCQFNLNNKNVLTPSKRLAGLYGADERKDFLATGDYLMGILKKFADLKPSDAVLDVGCGTGLLALPLSSYLIEGYYEGFDTISAGINWCRDHISRKHTNFHFQVANIYHNSYNPAGKINAAEYRFPFNDNTFDVIILRSIFTHFRPKELEHYVQEIARTLKKGGRSFVTYHLINPVTVNLMRDAKSYFDFKYRVENNCYTTNFRLENELAYEESYIQNLYSHNDLKIKDPILYGSWRLGSSVTEPDFQDIIIGYK